MHHTETFVTPVVEHGLQREITNKEGNVLFNDTHNTFYISLYGIGLMVKDYSDNERKSAGTATSEAGLSSLAARDLLYAPCHSLRYTSYELLARSRNSTMDPTWDRSMKQPIPPLADAPQ